MRGNNTELLLLTEPRHFISVVEWTQLIFILKFLVGWFPLDWTLLLFILSLVWTLSSTEARQLQLLLFYFFRTILLQSLCDIDGIVCLYPLVIQNIFLWLESIPGIGFWTLLSRLVHQVFSHFGNWIYFSYFYFLTMVGVHLMQLRSGAWPCIWIFRQFRQTLLTQILVLKVDSAFSWFWMLVILV